MSEYPMSSAIISRMLGRGADEFWASAGGATKIPATKTRRKVTERMEDRLFGVYWGEYNFLFTKKPTTMKSIRILLAILCVLFVMQTSWAQEENWVGTWQYEAPQADYQYQKGKIIFTMEDGELTAVLNVNENLLPADQLEVSENEASFRVMIQGEPIKISLTKDDEKLSGEASYSQGTVPITAEKSV